MTWSSEGLFANFGDFIGFSSYKGPHVLDYAGGTVVHMSAGLAALCGAFYLGKRKLTKTKPANIPFIILEQVYCILVGLALMRALHLLLTTMQLYLFTNTNIASSTSMITWVLYDRFLTEKHQLLMHV